MLALPIEPIELNPLRIWQDNCFMGFESLSGALVVPMQVTVMEEDKSWDTASQLACQIVPRLPYP
jgi:hypothetical protein